MTPLQRPVCDGVVGGEAPPDLWPRNPPPHPWAHVLGTVDGRDSGLRVLLSGCKGLLGVRNVPSCCGESSELCRERAAVRVRVRVPCVCAVRVCRTRVPCACAVRVCRVRVPCACAVHVCRVRVPCGCKRRRVDSERSHRSASPAPAGHARGAHRVPSMPREASPHPQGGTEALREERPRPRSRERGDWDSVQPTGKPSRIAVPASVGHRTGGGGRGGGQGSAVGTDAHGQSLLSRRAGGGSSPGALSGAAWPPGASSHVWRYFCATGRVCAPGSGGERPGMLHTAHHARAAPQE